MTTPSPELRRLYLKVIRRVHPDGAIDEQDRLRCEHLTQVANHAYALGDEAALKAVLEPTPPHPGWHRRRSTRRPFVTGWTALMRQPWRMAGAAIAFVAVCGCIIIAVRPSKTAHVVQQQAGAQQPRDNPEPRTANIPAPDVAAGETSRRSAIPYGNKILGRSFPSHNHADPRLYLEALKTQVENNFNRHSLNAPDGTSADIAVVIRENGQPVKPHLMMSSGYSEVDSACLQSVKQIPTFGSTPTGASMTVNFQCTVGAR